MIKLNLGQLHNKYNLIMEHSQIIILFFDKLGQIIDCNPAARENLGYNRDIYKIKITEIFQKAVKLINNRMVINMKYEKQAAETVAYRKNQTCFIVELRIIINERTKPFLGVCLATDITERKIVLGDLKSVRKDLETFTMTKSELLANVSHELKTPVNGIKGLTENLLETELMPKQVEALNIIHRCCDNMNTLINNLLDFAKMGSNKLVLERREFNLRGLIDGMVELNISQINEKGLSLLIYIAIDIPSVVIGDELRLGQVINNLLSNAVKFTSIGKITLEVVKTIQTEDEIELLFMVMDTGIGISIEEREKLFLSFSQVDSSITRRFGGTGLGLSICKMLVEAMHGEINVDSEKNKGSTFSFTVRLGIKEESVVSSDNYDRYNLRVHNEEELDQNIIESKYFKNSVYEQDVVDQTLKVEHFNNSSIGIANEKSISNVIRDAIEKLLICIEVENWDKAEETAVFLKSLMPENNKKLKNKALGLVILVRKEDHETSINEVKELELLISEVILWKQ
ncbi:MAG TPA: ATP-binding protein [Mobilitalea sp.]|nr:ATP-binding protein [Mobilitalea sp.]